MIRLLGWKSSPLAAQLEVNIKVVIDGAMEQAEQICTSLPSFSSCLVMVAGIDPD